MAERDDDVRVGTAGWTIPRDAAAAFPGERRHLHRYAQAMGCVEINSSFYRSHRRAVYERWAAETPERFRFAVKLPKSITHEARLRAAREPLQRFLAEVEGLGQRLAVVLVQLPPSFAFDARPVRRFFALVRELYDGAIVCEPRHVTWFTPAADRSLVAARISRAAADPASVADASRPGGWLGADGDGRGAVLYHRWHGSPRLYWSRYETAWLRSRAAEVSQWPAGADRWCVFDNTASGAALVNALEFCALLGGRKIAAAPHTRLDSESVATLDARLG